MQYNPPLGGNPNDPFVNANPSIPTAGSVIPAAGIEYDQREIVNAITAAGLTPTNSDLTQLSQAIGRLGKIPLWQDNGTTNHVVITPSPAILAYNSPLFYAVRIANTNTDGSDISVSGLGTVQILRPTQAGLSANDMIQNGVALFTFDGVKFQLLNPQAANAIIGAVQLLHWGVDTGTVNHLVVNLPAGDAIGSAWPTPLMIAVIPANSNTGAANFSLNGFANVNVTRSGTNQLNPNDIVTGCVALMIFDGAEAQLINPQTFGGSPFTPAGRLITLSGPITMSNADYRLYFSRTAGLGPSSIVLPLNASVAQEFVMTDIIGNGRAYPLTITAPTGHNLMNAGNNELVVDQDFFEVRFSFAGAPQGTNLWTYKL